MAELIRRRLDLELWLRRPELRSVELPEPIVQALGGSLLSAPAIPAESCAALISVAPPTAPAPASPPIREFLAEFVAYIQAENVPHHAINKIGCLKSISDGFSHRAAFSHRQKSQAERPCSQARRKSRGVRRSSICHIHYRKKT
ncbi:MAG: hypothetical protein PHC88_14265 [Terrimicrobiaceae bacterium]|nr:hypothetical protein [Terrimicrobiaceae bacterium]